MENEVRGVIRDGTIILEVVCQESAYRSVEVIDGVGTPGIQPAATRTHTVFV
jgi:hypothetical protein